MNLEARSAGSLPVRARERRVVDEGAILAGWVGLGMAMVIAISFELIVAVQALVLIVAPLAGLLIGMYANQRSARWRPIGRVMTNAAWAGLVTGLGLAAIYALLRLLFVFADSGYRPPGQGGQIDCRRGPECTYLRYVEEGRGPELAAAGATDGASFGDLVVTEQAGGALAITLLTLGGAVAGGAVRAVTAPRSERRVGDEPGGDTGPSAA